LSGQAQTVSVEYRLVVKPAEEGDVGIYTVEGGRRFRLVRTYIYFPAGDYFELSLHLKHGIHKVIPRAGEWAGDNMAIRDMSTHTWGSQEPVIVHYKNVNATQTREAYLHLEGELE